jgi:eukaryotic-like serine/threonine-protein kinase
MHPETIGEFAIEDLVGEGGMGMVYRAHDSTLDRTVAIKVLHPALTASADSRKRFRAEAKAVGRLAHPNIVQVYQWSEDSDDRQFLVMELLDGQCLREVLEEVRFDPPEAMLAVARPLVDALAHAHSHNIVHRDIKPGNVMVLRDGTIKLMDFGIARMEFDEQQLTITGALVGSPSHMAPEVINGKRGDAATDQFSLGTVFYEMVTGVSPFGGGSPAAIFRAVDRCQFEPVTKRAPSVDPRLAAVIERMLERAPEDRFPSIEAIGRALAPLVPGWLKPESTNLALLLNARAATSAAWRTQQIEHLARSVETARRQKDWPAAVSEANRLVCLDPSRHALLDQLSRVGGRRLAAPLLGAAVALALLLTLTSQLMVSGTLEGAESSPVAPPRTTFQRGIVPDPDRRQVSDAGSKSDSGTPKAATRPGVQSNSFRITVRVFPWASLQVGDGPVRAGAPQHVLRLPRGRHKLTLRHDKAFPQVREVALPGNGPGGSQLLTTRIQRYKPARLALLSDRAGLLKVGARRYRFGDGKNEIDLPLAEGTFREQVTLVYEAEGCTRSLDMTLVAAGFRSWQPDCSSP